MTDHPLCRVIGRGMVALLLATGALAAQMDQQFARSRQQNAQALQPYTWKAKTEIQKGGETRSTQVAQMRYGPDGTLQKTVISNTAEPIPTGGIRGRIARRKKEGVMELLDRLAALATSYGELPAEKMRQFMAGAVMTPEVSPDRKWFRLAGKNVLQPGDSMTVWVDAATRNLRKVEVQTTLEKQPVRIVSDFRDLANGANCMARSVLNYPDDSLTVITENFDYERLTR